MGSRYCNYTVYIKHAGERDIFHIIGLLSTTDFKYYTKGGVVLKLNVLHAAMPCRHDQMLPVVFRILARLSHCWCVCVFSPVG